MTTPTSPLGYRNSYRVPQEELIAALQAYETERTAKGVDYGHCLCRCGAGTRIPTTTNRQAGYYTGIPLRFIRGHKSTDDSTRDLACGKCGKRRSYNAKNCMGCIERGETRTVDPLAYEDDHGRYRRVHLGGEMWALVDESDYASVTVEKWHADINRKTTDYYAKNSKLGRMHRFLMGVHGRWTLVDHVSKPTLNNRRYNLRVCDVYQNNANRLMSEANKVGLKGVDLLPNGLYRAQISHRNRKHILGTAFVSAEDAHAAYLQAALRLHGEFANPG